MTGPKAPVVLALMALVAATTGLAATLRDDPEEREDRVLRGRKVFQESCLICHSAELSESQAITEAQWAAEIDKMIGWGAPVAKDERDDLQLYLAETFVRRDHAPGPGRMSADQVEAEGRADARPEALAGSDPARGGPLFASQCAACHGSDGRGGNVGNNLVEKPVLLRPAEFHQVIVEGRHKMPSFRIALNTDQERDILAWLRRQGEPTANAARKHP